MKRWLPYLVVPVALLLGVFLLMATLGVRGDISAARPWEIFYDLKFQPRLKAQGESEFFADGSGARPLVPGTVAFGGRDYLSDAGSPKLDDSLLQAEDDLYRGKRPGSNDWVSDIPIPLTHELLKRGKNRYAIHCRVCHGETGYGDGITSEYNMVGIANYHQDKYRLMAAGEIYHTIANGKGTMQPYGHQIAVRDRWAIVAWVRVLQRSQNVKIVEVPEPFRGQLEREK